MRKLIVLAVLAAVASAAIAVPAFAATKTVKIGDIFYVKKGAKPTVTAKVGDTIKWNWSGKFLHNVTVKSGPAKFHSKTQKSGSFSKKITKAGTYNIYCTVHGAKAQSMKLVVK